MIMYLTMSCVFQAFDMLAQIQSGRFTEESDDKVNNMNESMHGNLDDDNQVAECDTTDNTSSDDSWVPEEASSENDVDGNPHADMNNSEDNNSIEDNEQKTPTMNFPEKKGCLPVSLKSLFS